MLRVGYRVGIIANQTPVINAEEARKGAQFIKMCNQQYVAWYKETCKESTN